MTGIRSWTAAVTAKRVELNGPVSLSDRLLRAATDVGEALGKPFMSTGVAGIEF